MTTQGLLIFLLIVVFVVAIVWYVTQDARKRGFREFQVFLLALACVFFFPISFVLYLILRPSLRNGSQ